MVVSCHLGSLRNTWMSHLEGMTLPQQLCLTCCPCLTRCWPQADLVVPLQDPPCLRACTHTTLSPEGPLAASPSRLSPTVNSFTLLCLNRKISLLEAKLWLKLWMCTSNRQAVTWQLKIVCLYVFLCSYFYIHVSSIRLKAPWGPQLSRFLRAVYLVPRLNLVTNTSE